MAAAIGTVRTRTKKFIFKRSWFPSKASSTNLRSHFPLSFSPSLSSTSSVSNGGRSRNTQQFSAPPKLGNHNLSGQTCAFLGKGIMSGQGQP